MSTQDFESAERVSTLGDNGTQTPTPSEKRELDPPKANKEQDVAASVEPAAQLNILDAGEELAVKHDLEITENEIQDLENKLNSMSIEHAYAICTELWKVHKNDQNFPQEALNRIEDFVKNHEAIVADPVAHSRLIREIKIECILSTEFSPYLEVRANTENTDDPTLPSLTFRVLVIGSVFAAAGSFIDTLFNFRQPAVYVGTNVGQLLAYPIGLFMAKTLPTYKWRWFGYGMSLNPGPFSTKEHMLITLMCNVSLGSPYTVDIVPVQFLPLFFNEPFAHSFGYQVLNTIGTTFVGYGVAGLCRRFLVWPVYAIWPGTLSNLALIKAFHTHKNESVRGPFGMWRVSRERFFLLSFLAMAIYYWFPGYIFPALSTFSWLTWIAPNNAKLDWVCGIYGGVGFNPWPTFDWNIAATTGLAPLTIPLFTVANLTLSSFLGGLVVLGIYLNNHFNTGYLPLNSPNNFDNMGNPYNVSAILTPNGLLDNDLYQQYSQPWMSAGTLTAYIWYFIMYAATVVYIPLFHRNELTIAFKSFWRVVKRSLRKGDPSEDQDEDLLSEDVHARLMRHYDDVPEYVYLAVLLVSAAIGMVGVGVYPTDTSPVVMVFGLIMCFLTVLPVGIIQSVTGLPVPTNVIAEFVGGSLVSGNANALMYFKTYGYISTYQALSFVNDLKLGHYMKCPPWHTFCVQMWASLIFSFVSTACINLALGFNNVCTAEADFRFTCPNQYQFFTAAVFWGDTTLMLIGFPVGVVLVMGASTTLVSLWLVYWGLRKMFPRNKYIRQIHPIMLTQGPINYPAPYNFSYALPWFYVTFLSFKLIRPRFPEFWAKYNYVLAAAFPTGIAITAIIIFFGLAIPDGGTLGITWWGSTVVGEGCEGGGCTLLPIPEIGYFGPPPGQYT